MLSPEKLSILSGMMEKEKLKKKKLKEKLRVDFQLLASGFYLEVPKGDRGAHGCCHICVLKNPHPHTVRSPI